MGPSGVSQSLSRPRSLHRPSSQSIWTVHLRMEASDLPTAVVEHRGAHEHDGRRSATDVDPLPLAYRDRVNPGIPVVLRPILLIARSAWRSAFSSESVAM